MTCEMPTTSHALYDTLEHGTGWSAAIIVVAVMQFVVAAPLSLLGERPLTYVRYMIPLATNYGALIAHDHFAAALTLLDVVVQVLQCSPRRTLRPRSGSSPRSALQA